MEQTRDPLVSEDEIRRITGGYNQQAKQLAELHRQGFWRARRSRMDGSIILEREHYNAVCRGADAGPVASSGPKPVLRPA